MITDKFGQPVFDCEDIIDLYMKGHDVDAMGQIFVDDTVNIEFAASILDHSPALVRYDAQIKQNITVQEFDRACQSCWFMPDSYKHMDIAEHVLSLCKTDAEIQRCGQELLLFQERNLFDLLRYLKYLVDLMTEHELIWGVGRGSSVASFVLYKLGVHRIDSLYYDLDPAEFLR